MKPRIDEVDITFEKVKPPSFSEDVIKRLARFFRENHPYSDFRSFKKKNVIYVNINGYAFGLLYVERFLFTSLVLMPAIKSMKEFANEWCEVYDLKDVKYTRAIKDGVVILTIEAAL